MYIDLEIVGYDQHKGRKVYGETHQNLKLVILEQILIVCIF